MSGHQHDLNMAIVCNIAECYIPVCCHLPDTHVPSHVVCRRIKSPAELSLLHSSAQIAAQGITAAMASTAPGILEHRIAAEFGAFAATLPVNMLLLMFAIRVLQA